MTDPVEMINPYSWEEYHKVGNIEVTVNPVANTIEFSGSARAGNATNYTDTVGVHIWDVDLTCVDEISFDYDITWGWGAVILRFRLDNDILWEVASTTTSGTKTIDTSAITGNHRVSFHYSATSFAWAYEPWEAGTSMPVLISNITGLGNYINPVINSVGVDITSGVVPIDVTYTADIVHAGTCPPSTNTGWTVYKDDVVYLDGVTTNPLTLNIVYPGTYQAKYTLSNPTVTLTEFTEKTWLGVDTLVDFSFDKPITNTTEPIHFYSYSQDSYGYPRNGWSFEWDFGDGTTSTEEHPVKTYTAEGVYDVELNVTTPWMSSRRRIVPTSHQHTVSAGELLRITVEFPSVSVTPYLPDDLYLVFNIACSDVSSLETGIDSILEIRTSNCPHEDFIWIHDVASRLSMTDELQTVAIKLSEFTDTGIDPENIAVFDFYNYTSVEGEPTVTLVISNVRIQIEPVVKSIVVDNDVSRGRYSCDSMNRYGILLLHPTDKTKTLFIHDRLRGVRSNEVKVTHSLGDISVAEFELHGLKNIDGYEDVLVRGHEVYIVAHDGVVFCGFITDIVTKTNDYFGNPNAPGRIYKVTCEGSSSMLKSENYSDNTTIQGNPLRLFEQIVPEPLRSPVTPPSFKDQSRSMNVSGGNLFAIVSNIAESSGYRMVDVPGHFVRRCWMDHWGGLDVIGTHFGDPNLEMIPVDAYVIYLKRDPAANNYVENSMRNSHLRFSYSGYMTHRFTGDCVLALQTPLSELEEPIDPALRSYMRQGVFMFIAPGRQRVGFTSRKNTNITRTLDVGTQLIDTDVIDTSYVDATNYTLTVSTDGRKVSANIPACVVVGDQGHGDNHTFLKHPLGSEVIVTADDSIVLKGHNLFDRQDPPTDFFFSYDNGVSFTLSNVVPAPYQIRELFYDNIPVTVFSFPSYDIPVGAFVHFGWDDTIDLWRTTRMYVHDLTGAWTPERYIGIGSTTHHDQAYKIVERKAEYVLIKLDKLLNLLDWQDPLRYTPKNEGCIVFKLRNSNNPPYTLESPQIDSPIWVRGVVTKTITGGSGMGIPELEVVASSYIATGGVFSDIGSGKVMNIHAFHSIYPQASRPAFALNVPTIAGDSVKVRFNDAIREYSVAKSTHNLDKSEVKFELGGKRKDIPDAVKTAISIHNISG